MMGNAAGDGSVMAQYTTVCVWVVEGSNESLKNPAQSEEYIYWNIVAQDRKRRLVGCLVWIEEENIYYQ